MTKASKVQAVKIRADEVTVGMTVKGNLLGGARTVAEIKFSETQMRGGVMAKDLTFCDADGNEFFVGRVYAKATLA